jgi:hypothetical protein
VAQVVEHLPHTWEAQNPKPSTTKEKKRKKECIQNLPVELEGYTEW